MRTPLSLIQVKSLLTTVQKNPIDAGVQEMIPAEIVNYVQSAPDIASNIAELERVIARKDSDFQDLNLALVDYANQSGAGQMMMDNLKLCLDQVRERKKQAVMQGTIGRQGLG